MRHTVLALLSFAALAAPAQAATRPVVSTAPAVNISPLSATVGGNVTAGSDAATVHFEYGTTKKYGHKTASQAVGAGTTPVPVFATLSGLRSSTRYHFRLVAVSKAGRRASSDRSFKTLPPTTAPVFTPNPVVFGRPFTISGQLIGTGASGARVTLLGTPFPFTQPFGQIGNKVVANPDGTYAFTFTSAVITTQLRIHADTNPPINTPVITMPVSSLISLNVTSHTRRGRRVRFSGTVRPPQNGLLVRIQRRVRGGAFRTVGQTNLRRRDAHSSKYGLRLRLKRSGTYRAVVISAGGAISQGVSPAKSIRVTRR